MCFRFETRQDRPQYRKKDQKTDSPGNDGVYDLAFCCGRVAHNSLYLLIQILTDNSHQEDGYDVGEDDGIYTTGRAKAYVLTFKYALEYEVS